VIQNDHSAQDVTMHKNHAAKIQNNGGFDEMLDGAGTTRAHYQKFRSCWRRFRRMISASGATRWTWSFLRQGITFNVYGDEKGAERFFRSTSSRASFRPANGSFWNAG